MHSIIEVRTYLMRYPLPSSRLIGDMNKLLGKKQNVNKIQFESLRTLHTLEIFGCSAHDDAMHWYIATVFQLN